MKSLKSNISYLTIWLISLILFVLYSLGILVNIGCVSDTCNGLEIGFTIIFSIPSITVLSLVHFGYLYNYEFFQKYKNFTIIQSLIFIIANWYLLFVWNNQIKNVYFAFEPLQIVAYFWICFAVFLPFFANLIVLKFPNKLFFYLTFVLQVLTIFGIIFATFISPIKKNEYTAFNYKRNQQICNEEKNKLQNYLNTAKFQDKYNKYTFNFEATKVSDCENNFFSPQNTNPYISSTFNISITAFDDKNQQVLNVEDILKLGVASDITNSNLVIASLEKQIKDLKENYELTNDEEYEIMSYAPNFNGYGTTSLDKEYLDFGCSQFITDPQKGVLYPKNGEVLIYQYKRLKGEQWFKCVSE